MRFHRVRPIIEVAGKNCYFAPLFCSRSLRRGGPARAIAGRAVRHAMALVYHPDTELMAATDWGIDGTLLDADGNPFDLSNATLSWTLIGPAGTPVLQSGDATITVVGDPTAGTIHIAVHNAQTA